MCAGIRTEVNSSSIIREISEEDLKSMIAVNPDLKLLDVRESWEREQSQISPSIHQPLGKLIEQISASSPLEFDHNQDLVVYCKAGVRSRVACQALQRLWDTPNSTIFPAVWTGGFNSISIFGLISSVQLLNIGLIGGTDSSGGAGVETDKQTVIDLGHAPHGIVSAITLQNTNKGIRIFEVPSEGLESQFSDLIKKPVHGLKIGMLPNANAVEMVSKLLQRQKFFPVVLDPLSKAVPNILLLIKEVGMPSSILSFLRSTWLPLIYWKQNKCFAWSMTILNLQD